MSSLKKTGEFSFIDRVTHMLGSDPSVVVGVGDDCAVLEVGDRLWLVSCDASLEQIHFRREWIDPYDIGWKAAASALSDIAAMGGTPRFVLVTLATPATSELLELEALYRGIRDAVASVDALIVGGDTTASASGWVIDVTVIGEVEAGGYCTRAGARSGDCVVVSGWPGMSAGGLHALAHQIDTPECVRAHLHPQPRIKLGHWCAAEERVHALIDLSDGLAQDAGHLAQASGLGVDLDSAAIPLHPALSECHPNALAAALAGGEDYELIFALDAPGAEACCATAQERFGLPLHIVGSFTDAWSGVRVDGEVLEKTGYTHF